MPRPTYRFSICRCTKTISTRTGREQEFVVVDVIGVDKEEIPTSLSLKLNRHLTLISLALKQCPLSMMNAQLHNGGRKSF